MRYMSIPSHQEKFEELDRQTVDQVSQVIQGSIKNIAGATGKLLTWVQEIVKTQSRELALLRELEASVRDAEHEANDVKAEALYTRIDNILAQLTQFRQQIAEQNATQITAAP